MAEAVKGAGLICFCIPANGFPVFIEKLIPHLEDGMVIHFTTGNYGSLMLRKMMRDAGCAKEVVIGGWASLPYGTRTKILGAVKTPIQDLLYRAITLRGAALPTKDNDQFFGSIKYLPAFDSVKHPVRGDTVIDIALTNVNPVLHVPGTLLGVGAMENFGVIYGEDKYDFAIYSHAYCPSISRVQLAFYKEQQQLAEAMGVGIQSYHDAEFFSRTNVLGAEFMGPDIKIPFDEQFDLFKGTGPFTVDNRYITEDVPVGCHICHELGKKFGVKTPTIDSMIHLASIVMQQDYFEKGWTLSDLGIAELSKEQLLQYLHKG
jgi:opine dehydrogenase